MKATPESLRLTQAEFDALVRVRDDLRDGRIRRHDPSSPIRDNHFDMSTVLKTGDCGTAMCIGGWVWAYVHGTPDLRNGLYAASALLDYPDINVAEHWAHIRSRESPTLDLLFYPLKTYLWDLIEPDEAAQAITNVLEHHDPMWDEILETTDD